MGDGRIAVVDGLRGIAIAIVVWFHLWQISLAARDRPDREPLLAADRGDRLRRRRDLLLHLRLRADAAVRAGAPHRFAGAWRCGTSRAGERSRSCRRTCSHRPADRRGLSDVSERRGRREGHRVPPALRARLVLGDERHDRRRDVVARRRDPVLRAVPAAGARVRAPAAARDDRALRGRQRLARLVHALEPLLLRAAARAAAGYIDFFAAGMLGAFAYAAIALRRPALAQHRWAFTALRSPASPPSSC